MRGKAAGAVVVAAAAAILAAAIILRHRALPLISYHVLAPAAPPADVRFEPVRFDSSAAASITATISVGGRFPSSYEIKADDCLVSLKLNGRALAFDSPLCAYPQSVRFDIGELLIPGRNILQATVLNKGGHGGFVVMPDRADPLVRVFALFVSLCGAAFVWAILWYRRAWEGDQVLCGVCAWGIVLRIAYSLMTPYWSRGYDYLGHLDYIEYILRNYSLPSAASGWMYYQPPLYYAVAGAAARVAEATGSPAAVPDAAKFMALLCSMCFVLLWTNLSTIILPSRAAGRAAALLGVSWPGLVLFSSRVNNDVLLLPVVIGVISVFAVWLKHPTRRLLVALGLLLGACLLVKSNALVILAAVIAGQCLLLHGSGRRAAAAVLVLSALVVTPYYAQRYFQDGLLMLGGNVQGLDEGLRVENSPSALLSFSPSAVVSSPFTDSREPGMHRGVFLEYWLRSSLFGEFQFGEPTVAAKLTAAVSMLLLLLAVVEAARGRGRLDLALLILWGSAIAAHLAYRFAVPYSSAQDFRYTWFALVPVAYFAARALDREKRLLRISVSVLCLTFAASSGCFIYLALTAPLPMWR